MKIEFQLESTYLTELQFVSLPAINSAGEIRYDINISVEHQVVEHGVLVLMTVTAKSEDNPDKDRFECAVTQVGLFRFRESENGQFKDNIDFAQFANINGAAILFPFVRQTIASISANSKTGVALLPLVNFVARWEGIKAEKKEE